MWAGTSNPNDAATILNLTDHSILAFTPIQAIQSWDSVSFPWSKAKEETDVRRGLEEIAAERTRLTNWLA